MTFQLRYRLSLTEQAVFSRLKGDPNSIMSEGYLPGGAIWGSLAGETIQKLGLGQSAHENEFFRLVFLRNGIRCLNCYLLDEENKPIRLLPVPLSFQKEKSNPFQLYDLAAYFINEEEDEIPQQTLQNLKGFEFCRNANNGQSLYVSGVKTKFNYHTTRPDRLKGRSIKNAGAVFVYEALESGQNFGGTILGEESVLTKLQDNLNWKPGHPLNLRLGRSRSTQYGGSAALELLSLQPEPFISEIPDGDKGTVESNYLVLTLTSQLLLRGENGYPAQLTAPEGSLEPNFPLEELAELLDLNPQDLTLKRAYARRELVGGYLAVWGLPRPQWPAFKAGSVFVFEVKKSELNFTAAEGAGLGLRRGEGFGSFVLNWHGEHRTWTVRNLEKPQNLKQPAGTSEEFKKLVFNLIGDEFVRQAESKARLESAGFAASESFKFLSPALMGRLQLALHNQPDLTSFERWLESLRKPAQQQLERVRHQNTKSLSLMDHIFEVLRASSVYHLKSTNSIQLDLKTQQVVTASGQQPEIDQGLLNRTKRTYLLALLGELSRKKREGRNERVAQ